MVHLFSVENYIFLSFDVLFGKYFWKTVYCVTDHSDTAIHQYKCVYMYHDYERSCDAHY